MSIDPHINFPTRFSASTRHKAALYSIQNGYFAVHGPVPKTLKALVVQVLDDGKVSLCRGALPRHVEPHDLKITPVYALEPGGPPAVPTGRVFIRFFDQVDAKDREASLTRAGYVIVRGNPYARNTAWLSVASGSIVEALAGITRLAELPEVANVEPEMLKPVARKA